jgi:hypothetical protein
VEVEQASRKMAGTGLTTQTSTIWGQVGGEEPKNLRGEQMTGTGQ